MELTIVRNNHIAEITNFETYRTQLTTEMSKYKGYIPVTDDEAKSDRANLNKLKKAIEDKRKEVKSQIMAEYEPLEFQCKELTGIVDEAISEVDAAVKQAEEQYRSEKLKTIYKVWDELGFKLADVDQFQNPKWLNKTYSEKDIRKDMEAIINQINQDLAVLDGMNIPQLKAQYLTNFNLAATITSWNAVKDAEARLNTKPAEVSVEAVSVEAVSEQQYSVDLKIISSKAKLHDLGKWLRNNGYQFEQLGDLVEIEEK